MAQGPRWPEPVVAPSTTAPTAAAAVAPAVALTRSLPMNDAGLAGAAGAGPGSLRTKSKTACLNRLPGGWEEALFQADAADAACASEVGALLQELDYHTDSSHKQLQELCERLGVNDDAGNATAERGHGRAAAVPSPSARGGEDTLAAVLTDFGMPLEPTALRAALHALQQRQSGSGTAWSSETPDTTPGASSSRGNPTPRDSTPSTSTPAAAAAAAARQRKSGSDSVRARKSVRSRMEVRFQLAQFLQVPRNRVRVTTLWRHEAEALKFAEGTSTLSGRDSDKWYRRICLAFEAMLSNLLDENDSPLREVVFDLVSREAKATRNKPFSSLSVSASPALVERGASPNSNRPPPVDSVRRAVRCFGDAVVAVAAGAEFASTAEGDSFQRNQWSDCLSRIAVQFDQVLDETWQRLWPVAPGSMVDGGEGGVSTGLASRLSLVRSQGKEDEVGVLRRTLARNIENVTLLTQATQAISAPSEQVELGKASGAYLRQAITVSKGFLQLARDMTLLTGLWTSVHGVEATEHLNATVLRQEYRRVRSSVADLILNRARDILDQWCIQSAKELPATVKHFPPQQDRAFKKKILCAVVDWWRTGFSGNFRVVCMDVVTLSGGNDAASGASAIEHVQATLPILEEVFLDILRREIAVKPGCELGVVDEPRVRDIFSRLTSELNKHLDSEWHILQGAQWAAAGEVLPPPALFQAPGWATRPGRAFDYAAAKTAFLGAVIGGRYVVTRYVNRGAMGRVWVVEDKINPGEYPLCLKTFYCDCECEEMSNLSKREFKRSTLEELSQVERWMTSRTRLALSHHLVRVERVFWNTQVTREIGKDRVEGSLSGILMEFCDKGELTSYLWDGALHEPRAFDEKTAQFLFAQLTELLVELFAPPIAYQRPFAFDDPDATMSSLSLPVRLLQLSEVSGGMFGALGGAGGCGGGTIFTAYPPPVPTEGNALSRFKTDPGPELRSPFGSFSNQNLPRMPRSPFSSFASAYDTGIGADSFRPSDFLRPPGADSEAVSRGGSVNVRPAPGNPPPLGLVPPMSPGFSDMQSPLQSPYQQGLREVQPTKYFHNDIKLENLVVSGTTLKLIDFQSLAPLRPRGLGGQPQVIEHATPIYRHRRPNAMGESVDARAEGTAIWACGVILTRLLAAELSTDWVLQHRGLGTQVDLAQHLPEGHCLLGQEDRDGPRNLLDRIFSADATPSIVEVLMHPWVIRAREQWESNTSNEAVKRKLQEMLPMDSNPASATSAWIPLTSCIRVEGQPAPLREVEDIISIAVSLSDGCFRQEGRRRKRNRTGSSEGGSVAGGSVSAAPGGEDDEDFYEWQILVDCGEDEGDAEDLLRSSAMRVGIQALPSTAEMLEDDNSPAAPAAASVDTPTRKSRLSTSDGEESPQGEPRSSPTAFSPTQASFSSSSSSRGKGLWRRTLRSLIIDRFWVQVRVKEDLSEDEPAGVWWLRMKWLPPMVTGKKEGAFDGTGRRRFDSRPECSSFVQLQNLLLEGREEVVRRRSIAAAQASKERADRLGESGRPALPMAFLRLRSCE